MNDNNELIKDNLKNIKEKNNREAKKKKSDKSKSVLKEGLDYQSKLGCTSDKAKLEELNKTTGTERLYAQG